ncbi:MAG: hypothetical protein ACYC6L_02760 [Anaerolineae bacterium]
MTVPIRLGITSVCSPTEVGAADAPALLSALTHGLAGVASLPLELVTAQPISDPTSVAAAGRTFYDQRVDAVCVIAATWFEDYLVLDMLTECSAPLIAWARPGMETGSLCGMQQLGFMLRQTAQPYLIIFDRPEAPEAARQALAYAAAASLRGQLRRAGIGLLGHRAEGMTEITGHELALKRLLGLRVVGLDSQVFAERVAAVPDADVQAAWQRIAASVGRVTASGQSGLESLRYYTAMRAVMQDSGLAALAVGCYPRLMGKVCLAAALLAEEGLPMACEGDVNGALGMLLLTRLTGQAVHNTDLLDPVPADNALVFSHCGSGGFSLAAAPADITLAPVRLMNSGCCARFPAKPGLVTLLNIVPTLAGYRLAALYGEALPSAMEFPGNPLKVRFGSPYGDILAWIAREGLGHHWMAAYGDLRAELAHLAALTGCEWLSLE